MPPSIDRPAAATSAADLPGLRERLRSLAPNHASAVPREVTAAGTDQRPNGDSPQRGDKAGPRAFDAMNKRFWDQIDHLRALWEAHKEKWPRPAARDQSRPDDPPGSWRGNGDRFLSPEDNAQADVVIELLQECEPTVTALLERLQAESPFGARLIGLEHRLKGADRIKEKLVDKLQSRPAADLVQAAAQVSDAVRYTYCFDVEQYAEGYGDMHDRLESAGYRMIFRANRWIGDPEYRGMNTRWITADGDRFELQFHTSESFFAKEFLTHEPYDRIRTPGTSAEEEDELVAYERLVCVAIPEPDGVADILDVRPW